MHNLLSSVGTVLGLVGALICLAAGLTRILGNYYLMGFGTTAIFGAGTALMVLACLMKIETLLNRQ